MRNAAIDKGLLTLGSHMREPGVYGPYKRFISLSIVETIGR